MVREAALVLHAGTPLTVLLQQLSHDFHRPLGCVCSLQSKPRGRPGQRLLRHWLNELCSRLTQNARASPHQIHSKEGLLSVSALPAPHCFVSNAHLVLVRSHLGPPQPCRFTQHHCVSVSHLLDLNVGALCAQGHDTQS